jgi:hypothetical protein
MPRNRDRKENRKLYKECKHIPHKQWNIQNESGGRSVPNAMITVRVPLIWRKGEERRI